MLFRHIYTRELAQASYLIGCPATGEALVIDPTRDVEPYLELAAREGLHITAVTETHIHADFVSGTRELAARTAAQVYLSAAGPADWNYAYADAISATLLHDGDAFTVGNIRIDVLHTPGHTPEHLSFLVTDTASATEPMGIITGDFVFVGDVGRPDLLETVVGMAGSTAAAARALFRSLQRFRALPDYMQVWPGHGAGSACGRALGAVPQSTVGYERRFNWALGLEDAASFVDAIQDGQPTPPPYFGRMKRINRAGPALLATLPALTFLTFAQVAAAVQDGALVVDTRTAEEYGHGHIPRTINLPFNDAFVEWAGWLLPADHPIVLLTAEDTARRALRRLRLIGLDHVRSFAPLSVLDEWVTQGHRLTMVERRDSRAMRDPVARGEVAVLDVRTSQEYAAGHLVGSQHMPLQLLMERRSELPADRPILVQCQSGGRSAIAASLLEAQGVARVIDLQGGFARWQAAGNPVTHASVVTEGMVPA